MGRRFIGVLTAVVTMAAVLAGSPSGPASAAAVIDFQESFTGTSLNNPGNWSAFRYGEYDDYAPCLTALGYSSPAIALGAGELRGCGYDSAGRGTLRMMQFSPQMSATMIYNTPLPTANGMDITFRIAAEGPSRVDQAADGISFFLKKGSDSNDVPGFRGGSLSYSPYVPWGEAGMPGALLGVGFDLHGNWSTRDAGGTGCANRGPGFWPRAITIRGPGQGTTGYCYLGSSGAYAFSYFGTNRDRAAKQVRIVIDSADVPSPMVSVFVGPPGAASTTPIVTVPLPKEFLDEPTFKFGFGGSTGGLYARGEVWGLGIKPVDPNPPTGIVASWAGRSGGKETAAVTWVEPTSGPVPTSYVATAKRGTTVAGTCTAPAGTTTCTIPGLDTTDYDITLVTLSGADQSPPSSAVRISMAPVSITTTTPMPGGTVGTHYSQSLTATGGNGPYAWTLTSGTLPAGMTLDAEGTLSGLPTSSDTASFTLTATDSQGRTADKAFTLPIVLPLAITTSSLPDGATGTPYSQALIATGGTTYSWTLVSGALPTGLSLSPSGVISGNPTSAGSYSVTVRVTDEKNRTDERVLALGIDQTPPVQVTTTSIPSVVQGEAYTTTLESTGGIGPYTWSIISGSLPAGVSLVGDTLLGTPTAFGSFPITVRATDSSAGTSLTDDQVLTLVVYEPLSITTAALTDSFPGDVYSDTLAVTGGNGTYTWSMTGDLPGGLSLNAATGEISGTVSASALVGDYPITVHAEDGTGAITSRELVLTLTSPVVVVTTSLPSGGTDLEYGATLVADGGTGPYTWTLESGSLPSGLLLGVNGVITGTPTSAETGTITVKAVDSFGATATKTLSVTINQTPPVEVTLTPAVQSIAGVRGEVLVPSDAYLTTGFVGSPTYGISPTLPAGLSINSATGVVSGIPAATSAARTYTVTARGTGGRSATATITIAVDAPEPDGFQISPATQSTTGTAWTYLPPTAQMSAYGFTGPVTYRISPALPLGLTLDSQSGLVSGISQVTASGTWTITGTDGTNSDSATITLRVNAKRQVASPSVVLPTKLTNPGCTVVVAKSVRTNAGQTASVRISAAAAISRTGDSRPDFRVVRGSGGKVSVCVSGKRALTVTVALSAPAVSGYTSYSLTQRYSVSRIR